MPKLTPDEDAAFWLAFPVMCERKGGTPADGWDTPGPVHDAIALARDMGGAYATNAHADEWMATGAILGALVIAMEPDITPVAETLADGSPIIH